MKVILYSLAIIMSIKDIRIKIILMPLGILALFTLMAILAAVYKEHQIRKEMLKDLFKKIRKRKRVIKIK